MGVWASDSQHAAVCLVAGSASVYEGFHAESHLDYSLSEREKEKGDGGMVEEERGLNEDLYLFLLLFLRHYNQRGSQHRANLYVS